ncbi:MAG: cell division topological specificity factor MinE [Psychromonas sp.]|jgi:cell division topological specificity factor|uniref:cell division topological specificity factor MinE n=1 Tax=unclassified Psychromonas TaxID=2614957 RepID=UPI0025B102BC|nr:cell division topological specificity factor MinE [Psychromonas sp. 14N.309.X.WAT.B.A12]MDN2662438.1 cell division topological specificity factor MinE [Psychromonas sp. 14N.309.X.WAT.B.A12]
MGLLQYFIKDKPKKGTAKLAKDRLQIIVAHEHSSFDVPSYMPELQKELVAVIRKYMDISTDDVKCEFSDKEEDELSVLEVNVTLPKQK